MPTIKPVFCPKCKASLFLSISVKARLERFGDAEMICDGCGRPLILTAEKDDRLSTIKITAKEHHIPV